MSNLNTASSHNMSPPENQPSVEQVSSLNAESVEGLLEEAEHSGTQSLSIIRNIVDNSLAMLHPFHNHPLLSAIDIHKITLETLADSWLSVGARAFVIWSDDQVLFCRPEAQYAELDDPYSLVSAPSAPIRVRGKVLGYVSVIGLCGTLDQTRLVVETELLAQVVSLVLDLDSAKHELRAREQMKTEMDLAASIQIHLLPQTFPRFKGLDVFAHCLPARQVGGDFYNFNAHEQRPLVFAAGDVSGKGLPAALLMAMTRIVLHGAARFMPSVNPRSLLSRVNDDLYDDFTELGMFATVFVGCYDFTQRQLSYANAGHSPVIYCPAGGSALMFEADGPAVGVLPLNLSENVTIPFHSGDVLVVATDGFSEATNDRDEMFGYERLLKLVEELSPHSAATMAEEMFKRIAAFAGSQDQGDDQTIIILKGEDV